MKSMIRLIGISSCCLVIGAAAANAEPTLLADAELDRVAAGACAYGTTNCNDTPGNGFFPLSLSRLRTFNPIVGIPVEGSGCNTGGGPCDPSSSPFPAPIFAPIAPIDVPVIEPIAPAFGPLRPITFGPSPGGYCGPACDPGPAPAGG